MKQTDFTTQLKQALEHLHDFAFLQTLTLTQRLSQDGQTLDQSVRQLRSELLDAIEQLKPEGDWPPLAKEQRPYILLYGRYVQGLDTNELLEELAISLRQLRREHKRALEAVVDLLWNRLAAYLTPDDDLPLERRALAEIEAEQLINQAQPEDFALAPVIVGVLTMLDPVATNHQTEIINKLPAGLPAVRASRVILRQALLSLLSYAIDHAAAGQVRVSGQAESDVELQIRSIGKTHPETRAGVGLDISQKLITSLGGRVEFSTTSPEPLSSANLSFWQVSLYLPQAEDIPIVIMDDNVGLIDLFRRYLADQSYHILAAQTLEQILQLMQQTRPLLIVLDVMMPQQDGWEILQLLRTKPETREIPILICSVLNEPEIATSLGASDYLLKPVTQDALLAKLERWRQNSTSLAA